MIYCRNIKKEYDQLQVLKGIDLEISAGEIVTIVGKSGAGKSTLLHILGTLDLPDSGSLKIADTEVTSLSKKALAEFRNRSIGFVFQFHHLLPEFSALENVCIPAMINGDKKEAAYKKKATELLEYLGLGERLNHKPSQLSGGEQQRVAVARALINDPKIVFADEPTGNLDSKSSEELHNLFLTLRKDFNLTFVIVTHSSKLAALSDRQLEIRDGIILNESYA